MALREASKKQQEAIALITDCMFASVDVAVNSCSELLNQLKNHPELIRHEVKKLMNNVKRYIHEYQAGCMRIMDGNIEVLAEFNDIMDGYTANNVEMLRLAFRSLFVRVGATDPDLCSYAETAVSITSFANQAYESMNKKCLDVGLQSPKIYRTQFIRTGAMLRDVTALANLICRKHGVPHLDFNKDKQSVDALDALQNKLLNGRKLVSAIQTAHKKRRKDGTGEESKTA